MKADIPNIGKNIRFLRRSRNWTLIDLARKIGIREGPPGRIELGTLLISNQSRLQKTDLFENLNDKSKSEDLRPINAGRAAGRFAATFLMPEKAVRASVSQFGVTQDAWSWGLFLRIKHRFGVSAQSFLYRLHELDLISPKLTNKLDTGIKEFYDSTGFQEPDSTRRCLTPNGRFFDLFTTALNLKKSKQELIQIQDIEKKYKIVRK